MNTLKDTVMEVLMAVLPVTVTVIILQLLLGLPLELIIQFLVGAAMVSIGLILFLLGVRIGLLEIGEATGAALTQTGKMWLLILFGFLLSAVVTVADPDVRVLATQIDAVSGGAIPKNPLIISVGLGVGFYIAVAIIRVIFDIPLKYVLMVNYILVFIFAALTPAEFAAVSLDAGGVTTGPLAVPVIMALGIGIATVMGGRSASADGFGYVALGAIGPILAVLLLGVIYG
ncbi:MAG: DUF1538 domain-containing protein [Clostridia bacterium]|nr:DUF1538 domain-containing protein [Clostridia bacterium]